MIDTQLITMTHDLQVNLYIAMFSFAIDQVKLNGNSYSGQQAQKLRSQPDLFSISEIGDTLVLTSLSSQLWVEWHRDGTLEIGLPESASGAVRGLCGNYNGVEDDDRVGREGQALRTTSELEQAWAVSGPACVQEVCAGDRHSQAWKLCNVIR